MKFAAEDVAEIAVVDLDYAGSNEEAGRVGQNCVAQGVDVTVLEQLDRVLSGADAYINSARYQIYFPSYPGPAFSVVYGVIHQKNGGVIPHLVLSQIVSS